MVESGADVSPEQCERYGIVIVPMHVTFGSETMEDGSIYPLEIYSRCNELAEQLGCLGRGEELSRCNELGEMPKTSGCTPGDFEKVFDRIHAEQPDATILHLAYSEATTCSHQSSKIAAQGRDYVYSMDTRFVSVGQGLVAVETAKYIEAHPDATVEEIFSYAESVMDRILLGSTVEEIFSYAESVMDRILLGFVPTDLGFLKAGGRLSNVAFLGAHLLKFKPCIEVLGGKCLATKKFRGSMLKCAHSYIDHMIEKGDIDYSYIGLAYSVGLSDELRTEMEAYARELGFKEITWTTANWDLRRLPGPRSAA